MPADIHYFGIRHHGPGSARAVLAALDELQPTQVLIEGPADCSDLMPLLADKAMLPPVALLAYAEDDPGSASFWPFATFSPEYQAICWAVRTGADLAFIDLPVSWRIPKVEEIVEIDETDEQEESEELCETEDTECELEDDPIAASLIRDPIGILAYAAGYEDGESWWSDVIEENPEPGPIFAAVADAMTALREEATPPDGIEAAREAHMRLEIAKAAKTSEGPVAVICGAWHVPALKAKHIAKDDRALLKGAPKRKIAATWAPWTSPRLATYSGYGAGVAAPNWCAHLWEGGEQRTARWIGKIVRLLREDGHIVSTASLIETERLAMTLAALRERPQPSFEELRDAAIATLCMGNPVQWMSIAERLLVGAEVGAIPENVPRAPLLDDLQRQQKKARLKPEALDKELSLDLRSDSGLFRSTLLHRLQILDVRWGQLTDAGRSRGTFRERWMLRWDPEFAVSLVEHIIYGSTIERAATGRLTALLNQTENLGDLAAWVRNAMTAQLPEAATHGIERLGQRAAQTSDCEEMLSALPPMADLVRYGEARAGSTEQMETLLRRIAAQGALALPYAARGLDKEASAKLTQAVRKADGAMHLVELPEEEIDRWHDALEELLRDEQASPLVAGAAGQLLFAVEVLEPEEVRDLLARKLSAAIPVSDAAAFFEGFFEGACQRLLYDDELRGAIDDWFTSLDADAFQEFLPLFRRVFSSLDKSERSRLLQSLFGKSGGGMTGLVAVEGAAEAWDRHMAIVLGILEEGASNV